MAMAMSNSCMILRKAFSAVIPRALRPVSSPRILSAAVNKIDISYNSHHFCTEAKKINLLDQKLVTILKSDIKPCDRLAVMKAMPPVPAGFPFTIEDVHYTNMITLKREFDGEKIDVDVELPDGVECISIIGDDDSDGGGSEEYYSAGNKKEESTADREPTVILRVEISKENGKGLRLHGDATCDDIRVRRVSVDEPDPDSEYPDHFGPYYLEDGSALQSALGEFIEKIGVEKKYVEFLYNYLIRNEDRRDVLMVENMEKFFEE